MVVNADDGPPNKTKAVVSRVAEAANFMVMVYCYCLRGDSAMRSVKCCRQKDLLTSAADAP